MIEMSDKPLFIITPKLQGQINYIHSKYNKEWCGVLIVSVKGDNTDLKNMIITGLGLYPLNLGSECFTEFKDIPYLPEVWQLYNMENDDDINPSIGYIHSHHELGLGTNFSGRDIEELKNWYNKKLMFISLIVHKTSEYNVKLVWELVETKEIPVFYKRSIKFKNTHTGELNSFEEDIDKVDVKTISEMIVATCKIQQATSIEEPEKWFIEKYDKLEEENKVKIETPVFKGYNEYSSKEFDYSAYQKPIYNQTKINFNTSSTFKKDYTKSELKVKVIDIIAKAVSIKGSMRDYIILDRAGRFINYINEDEYFLTFVKELKIIYYEIANARNIMLVNLLDPEECSDELFELVNQTNEVISDYFNAIVEYDEYPEFYLSFICAVDFWDGFTGSVLPKDMELLNEYENIKEDFISVITNNEEMNYE